MCSTLKGSEALPERIGLSHTEGSGLGYSIGYSSLDLFLSQPLFNQTVVPFIDLRGHLFNNGKYAANAGFGLRFLSCRDQVFGANVFYDYLENKRHIYHQVGFGLEMLAGCWDVTLNGYFPVGDHRTNIYRFSYDFGSPNSLPIFLLKAREQLAMKGGDLSFTYRFSLDCHFEASVTIGPYLYFGRSAKTVNAFRSKQVDAYGGLLRAYLSFMDYAYLEGIGTYDSEFKGNGQVKIGLCLPFDLTFKECPCSFNEKSCLQDRLYSRVKRNEVIVIDSINRFSRNPAVLDPENEPL